MIKAIKAFFDSTDFDEVGDSMDLWWEKKNSLCAKQRREENFE